MALSPIEIPAGQERWIFVVPAPVGVMADAVISDIKERKLKTVGSIGYADSLGRRLDDRAEEGPGWLGHRDH